MVAVPEYTTAADEFESPTPINTDKKWKLAVVMPCHYCLRKKASKDINYNNCDCEDNK